MGVCICEDIRTVEDNALDVFEAVRAECPALSKIVVPDAVWADFRDWHGRPDDVAQHRSISLLALERGYLNRVTAPLHRFLLDGDSIRSDVQRQYVNDLRE